MHTPAAPPDPPIPDPPAALPAATRPRIVSTPSSEEDGALEPDQPGPSGVVQRAAPRPLNITNAGARGADNAGTATSFYQLDDAQERFLRDGVGLFTGIKIFRGRVMFDTGADVSIVSQALCVRYNLPIYALSPDIAPVLQADGAPIPWAGIVECGFFMAGTVYTHRFHVLAHGANHTSHELLVGTDLMRKIGLFSFDFDKHKVVIQTQGGRKVTYPLSHGKAIVETAGPEIVHLHPDLGSRPFRDVDQHVQAETAEDVIFPTRSSALLTLIDSILARSLTRRWDSPLPPP